MVHFILSRINFVGSNKPESLSSTTDYAVAEEKYGGTSKIKPVLLFQCFLISCFSQYGTFFIPCVIKTLCLMLVIMM
jgi:hypothetical protein